MSDQKIPDSWVKASIAETTDDSKNDIVDGPFGSRMKSSEYVTKGIHILRLQNIQRNLFVPKNFRFITEEKSKNLARHTYQSGDIIITKLGVPLGKACIIPKSFPSGNIVADLVRLRVNMNWFDVKFITYQLNATNLIKQFESHTKGATRPRVNLTHIRSLSIAVPPIKEQKRIVQKIETCLEKIDSAQKNLEQVEVLLKKYRSSLLAKAFRGELVEQNKSDEPVSVLLEKIRKEREKNQKGKKKKQEFKSIAEDEKPFEIPDSWEWVRLGEIVENLDGQRKPIKSEDRKGRQGQYPYYGASGIIDTFDDYIFEGTHLLISEDGANLLARIYPIAFIATGKFWVNNHAHIVKALSCTTNKFLEFYFESLDISRWVTGAAQPKFNQTKLNSVPVPLPPLAEQERILKILEMKCGYQENTHSNLKSNQLIFKNLKESILARAFEGELVEQIDSEGTGHELLEKILSSKEKKASKKKTKKK